MRFVWAVMCALCALSGSALQADEGVASGDVFRSADELVVRLPELERWRAGDAGPLNATIRLVGPGGEKRLTVDLADAAVPEALVVDLAGFGACSRVSVEVTGADQRVVFRRDVGPVPEVLTERLVPLRAGESAAIEPGTAMKSGASTPPKIVLPDASKLRRIALRAPSRVLSQPEITFPVVADADLPIPASENYVIVSRQSRAPADATRCSLYFSYRKAVYDVDALRLKKWRKFLVEVPLERAWGDRAGDETITLPLDRFAIHATDNPSPRGTNMLGESQGGLAQGGQSADVDDEGRIYFSNQSDGAGLVRFNPHTARFEQPPVDFAAEIRRLIPAEAGWTRNWDTDLGNLVCLRGRVYVVFARNYRVQTSNGNFETCSGVISIPQNHWDDATAFRADIRLHAGCWDGAAYRLYDGSPTPATYKRKLGNPVATTRGLYFAAPPDAQGGPWRLDLDDQGNTSRLSVVKSLDAAQSADGAALPAAKEIKPRGLPKQRLINVGGAGRAFTKTSYGEFVMTRAALALTQPDADEKRLVDTAGRHRTTFDGAPAGTLTVRFDVAGAIAANRAQHGELASTLSGLSLGPNYSVVPSPHEADRAIAVCEYGYFLSKLDFSRRPKDRKVYKEYLRTLADKGASALPARAGLGPYNVAWATHDNSHWLYYLGYTGMSRLRYSTGGKPNDGVDVEMFHGKLAAQPADGTPRDNVKDFLHLVPALGERMIDIGRGRPGRGGGAFSAGLELFDARTLGKSQTLVEMTRCYGLVTPVGRVTLPARDATARQEIFVASGAIRPEYLDDISDPARRPVNRDPKLFAYDIAANGPPRDLFGFTVPARPDGGDATGSLAFSSCRRFLVFSQHGGRIYTFHVGRREWIDGAQLTTADGKPVPPVVFDRPTTHFLTAPSGRLFVLVAPDGPTSRRVDFHEILVTKSGRIEVRPHLSIAMEPGAKPSDFEGVRCFLPDLVRNDGSCDFVLGGDQERGGPTVRVIDDFVPAR